MGVTNKISQTFSFIPHKMLDQELSPDAIATYAHIGRLGNPSIEELAECIGCTTTERVEAALTELEESGWIFVTSEDEVQK